MGFTEYRSNVYSQNGEDGVIAELVARLNLTHGPSAWAVEFGAWDGRLNSNSFNLIEAHNWSAVLIESVESRFNDLCLNVQARSGVYPIHSVVGFVGSAGVTLDDILKDLPVPVEYDLLSIDIDSFDLDVWLSHEKYSPKIVVIEINSGVAPGILQWHGPSGRGNSFSSTLGVARAKGYTLVCHVGNLVFVRSDLTSDLDLDSRDVNFPERLFNWRFHAEDPDLEGKRIDRLWSGVKGRLTSSGRR